MNTEMAKLVELLMDDKLPFQVVIQEDLEATQIYIPNINNPIFDVVCNKYSEGGVSGLLEILNHVSGKHTGYLNCEDAFDIINLWAGGG